MPDTQYHTERMWAFVVLFGMVCTTAIALGGCFLENHYDIQWIKEGGTFKEGGAAIRNHSRVKVEEKEEK